MISEILSLGWEHGGFGFGRKALYSFVLWLKERQICATGLHQHSEASVQMQLARLRTTPRHVDCGIQNHQQSNQSHLNPNLLARKAQSRDFSNTRKQAPLHLTAASSSSSQPIKPPHNGPEIQETGSYLPSTLFCKPIVRLNYQSPRQQRT